MEDKEKKKRFGPKEIWIDEDGKLHGELLRGDSLEREFNRDIPVDEAQIRARLDAANEIEDKYREELAARDKRNAFFRLIGDLEEIGIGGDKPGDLDAKKQAERERKLLEKMKDYENGNGKMGAMVFFDEATPEEVDGAFKSMQEEAKFARDKGFHKYADEMLRRADIFKQGSLEKDPVKFLEIAREESRDKVRGKNVRNVGGISGGIKNAAGHAGMFALSHGATVLAVAKGGTEISKGIRESDMGQVLHGAGQAGLAVGVDVGVTQTMNHAGTIVSKAGDLAQGAAAIAESTSWLGKVGGWFGKAASKIGVAAEWAGTALKKVPVLGAVVTGGVTIYRVGSHAVKGEWKMAGAELAAGTAETAGALIPVPGLSILAMEAGRQAVVESIDYATGYSGVRAQDAASVSLIKETYAWIKGDEDKDHEVKTSKFISTEQTVPTSTYVAAKKGAKEAYFAHTELKYLRNKPEHAIRESQVSQASETPDGRTATISNKELRDAIRSAGIGLRRKGIEGLGTVTLSDIEGDIMEHAKRDETNKHPYLH